MRKRVNKYLPEASRELGMWAIALLVNTSTWPEIKENWRLICQVFFNYSSNDINSFKQHHGILLSRISKITSDPNTLQAINLSKQSVTNEDDTFQFDDSCEIDDFDSNPLDPNQDTGNSNKRKRKQKSISRSSNVNKSVSNEITKYLCSFFKEKSSK